MILEALKGYYDRLAHDPETKIPAFGYSREKISWAIVIDRDGNLVPPVLDLREAGAKKPAPRELVVPQRVIVSGTKILANFLWGDTGYVLGADSKGKPERSREKLAAFRDRLSEISATIDDEGINAVLRFVDGWNSEQVETLEHWDEMIDSNIVFRLDGDNSFVHDRSAIRDAYARSQRGSDGVFDYCLITGEQTSISRLHPAIHGVRNANSTGARFVSFNLDAFESYGKKQGENAPIGEYAAFAYTTALNWLLRAGSAQKIQIGDATTVFWAEKPARLEHAFFYLFDPPGKKQDDGDVDDRGAAADIRDALEAIRQGRYRELETDPETKFYILGLSPNAARISVRFWHAGTVGDIAERVGRHIRDLAIEKQSQKEPDIPGMWQLLAQTAVQGKLDNVPPLLAGALMRSILTGGRYPESLLSAMLGRIRSERDNPEKNIRAINYYRMSLIKACLVRNYKREVSMSLNRENTDPAYLLGRLFAVLERSQEDASGGQLNSTIKDRYFSSASATPRAVFPVLLRLNQHHVAKGEHGGYFTRLIGEIMERLPAERLPTHMPLDGQGLFAIGYYHQRNDFFRKRESVETPGVTA